MSRWTSSVGLVFVEGRIWEQEKAKESAVEGWRTTRPEERCLQLQPKDEPQAGWEAAGVWTVAERVQRLKNQMSRQNWMY